jgi:hypothetical protein
VTVSMASGGRPALLPSAEGNLPSYSDVPLAALLAQVESRSAARQRRRRRVARAAAASLFRLVAWLHAAPTATAGVPAAASPSMRAPAVSSTRTY